jgi:hypothetical protein
MLALDLDAKNKFTSKEEVDETLVAHPAAADYTQKSSLMQE